MNKPTAITTLSFIIIIVLLVFGLRSPKKQDTNTLIGPIVAFGDSLVFGYGSTTGNDAFSVLSERIGRPIINAGKVRDTTATALARLDTEVLGNAPGVTIVLIGGNDVLRRVPKTETLVNVRTIVERLKGAGSEVILVAVSGMVYAKEYKDIAIETGAYYVEPVLDTVFGQAGLMHDAVHPNDKGYALFADRIEPTLRKVLGI